MTDRFGPGDAVVVRHLKRGRADVEYPGTIASDDGELVVVAATWTTEIDIGCARFERDDQSTEHYWRTRWYGIWETRTSEGQLKGCGSEATPTRRSERVVCLDGLVLGRALFACEAET